MNPLIIITILTFLLIGSIVIIWKQRGELKFHQRRLGMVLRERERLADAHIDRTFSLSTQVAALKVQLQQASKNDHRDARGRYSKAGGA